MIKKTLLLIFVSFLSFNAFSYMQVNFGIGTIDIDITYADGSTLKGNAGDVFVTYGGYTDSNVLYEVKYNYYSADYTESGTVYDLEVDILQGQVGYAFGDLDSGSFYLNGMYQRRGASLDGVSLNDDIDRSGFGAEVGYMVLSDDDINWEVSVLLDLDDCDYNCERLQAAVDFPISSSNWMFGLKVAFEEDVTWLNIGPTIKF
tara:strand:+ start:531 stop:1139 length:609 start_codon:yes stop_codon:yes gene_type:complete